MNMKISSERRMNSNFRIAIAVSLVLTLAFAQGCQRSVAQPQTGVPVAPEVLTVVAKAAGEHSELRLPARAVAGESVRIYARATGFLATRNVDMGDRVEAGQVLAVIAAPEIDQATREAEANLGKARADEELARVNFDRAASLIGSGAIAKEMFNERSAANDVAKAARAAAEARLASARERQGFKTVIAPFAGVISARNVERGDRVVGDQSGASSLFELIALDPLRIIVDVPQSAVLQVRAGVKAEVHFPELAGEALQAEVVRSAQSISENAGGMRVELRLPNPGERIPAGMVGEVRLGLPRAGQAVLVPISAVVQGAQGAQVAMIAADSTLSYRPVVVGRNLGPQIEILEGVAAGDSVIASPNALLMPGTKVTAKLAATP
jgi:RND family efflux transporter MFP subunit